LEQWSSHSNAFFCSVLLGCGTGKLSQQGCTEKTAWEIQLEQNAAPWFAAQGSCMGRPNARAKHSAHSSA